MYASLTNSLCAILLQLPLLAMLSIGIALAHAKPKPKGGAEGREVGQSDTLYSVRFLEPKRLEERASLPPELWATFDVGCNQEFLEVVRREFTIPDSKLRTAIAIGGLVRESGLSSCIGVTKEITVRAGSTFSGREHEVVKIRSTPTAAIVLKEPLPVPSTVR